MFDCYVQRSFLVILTFFKKKTMAHEVVRNISSMSVILCENKGFMVYYYSYFFHKSITSSRKLTFLVSEQFRQFLLDHTVKNNCGQL